MPRASSSGSIAASSQGRGDPYDSGALSTACQSTAVATPQHHSEAPTRVNSFDISAAHDMLHKLHSKVEQGDSTAIAEDEHLAHLHQLPPHKGHLFHLHHKHERPSRASEEAEESPRQACDLEKGSANAESEEPIPAVMLSEDEDPMCWSDRRKWITTALVSCLYFNATITSSVGTGATAQYIQQFSISHEVSALVLSIYMVGFCVGPPMWAPLSELYGRLLVNYISVPGYFFFNIGCALAPNVQTLLVCRFFVGLFAAAPQANSGGTISDIWAPKVRLWPMFTYSLSAFMGPTLGPLVGGFIAGTDLDSERWRWIYWLLCLISVVSMALVVIIQKETYAPVLLKRKARKMRAEAGRNEPLAPGETLAEDGTVAPVSWSEIMRVYVGRPFHMLFTELPLMYATLWTSFCYAIIFIFFEAYPVVFSGTYGFNAGEVGLTFLAIGAGIALSAPILGWFNRRSLAARIAAGGKPVPESRLPQVALSAPLFAIGFFWFGWTARASIHWIVPVLAGLPIGISLMLAFNSLATYAAECYHIYTASALAAMAFSRCLFAVFVPLFGRQMFENLGPGWASSILAFFSIAAIPVPFVFLKYGKAIRQRSKMCINA
ncbi:synaptic vesicle transporter SVOP and related transporters [Moesziomyces antarcticus T-34]|uniref:Synaptic vesicle transporter SVOP and related transporters n=1 Tax=Pseudozyma antarctica (strain T-34) TaxID=1151754 RepID=M9M777_PSEA3|nr:synaptic vesicle transporter SVOP and related transporters [Moesziomyces antarcticus T-34]